MFRSKRFFTVLGIGIFLGALFWWVYLTQRKVLPEIFQYVPTGMEQVMVNRAEKNIQSNTNMLVEIPQAVQEQFQQIKVMIIVQDETFSWDQMIFLQTRSEFLPENFLKTINPEEETIFTYLRLDDGQYVFGPQKIIQSYTKPTLEKALFHQPELENYLEKIRKSSLSIISSNDSGIVSQQYTSLLDSTKYLIMNISSDSNGRFDFAAYALLSQQQTGLEISFSPKFTSFLKESTIAYLELWKILLGNIQSDQLGSGLAQNKLLQKLLANNVAIIVSKGSNMFNLGATMISDNKDLFTDLEPYFPLVGEWLKTQPMLSRAQITSVQQPGKVGYDIVVQNIQKIWCYLEQSDNQTKISLGNPQIEWGKRTLKGYSKNSLAVLYVDMNQLLDLYKQFANIGVWWLSTDQESLFTQMKDKTLRWDIFIGENVIGLKWSIR